MTLNTMSTLGKRKPTDYIGAWLLPDITGEQWRENAACQKFPPQLWDPAQSTVNVEDRKRWLQAAEVCKTCPVIAECGTNVDPRDAGSVRAGLLVSQKGELTRIASPVPPVRGLHKDKVLAPCPSQSAKDRHRRHKRPCDVCWPNGKPQRLAECPSDSSRARHYRRKESCTDCNYTYRGAA